MRKPELEFRFPASGVGLCVLALILAGMLAPARRTGYDGSTEPDGPAGERVAMFDFTKLESVTITIVAESPAGDFIFEKDSPAGPDWMATIGSLVEEAEDAVEQWKFDTEAEAEGGEVDTAYDLIVEINGREVNKQCFG